ncbi:unnamed protein product [Staurois parvus]|uniref:Uncharacterized protein n=1 Tax=Staurois parvus TaxID=386267 RepID=A0ABN9EHQ7_9NEOB|nr:unnamed protein product [Staurois parvus]
MGPPGIGDHGAPVSLPKLKKAYEKGTRSISWDPLLTRALRQCPSFQMVSPPLNRSLTSCYQSTTRVDNNSENALSLTQEKN